MRLQFVKVYKSITGPVSIVDLPNFVVISGLNGSGKSHLLEAIAAGAVVVEGLEVTRRQPMLPVSPGLRRGRPHVPSAPPLVKLFRPGELLAVSNPAATAANMRATWAYLSELTPIAQAQQGNQPGTENTPDELDLKVATSLIDQGLISPVQVNRLKRVSGKRLIDLTREEFEYYSHPLAGLRDPFALSATDIFLSYHERRNRLEFQQWRHQKRGGKGTQPLSDEQFVEQFGPPPWEALNIALTTIDLPYSFTVPQDDDDDYTFQAQLRDVEADHVVNSDELSSGERTLLAIAMGLFGANQLSESIGMPRLLLLDEPDATLHPSMIKSLLDLTHDVLSVELGVQVVMSSHSPTTVALAPEPSLFTMRRSQEPRLIPASSRDHALASLTVGIPSLSVTLRNRRQVFCESESDVDFYHGVYQYIRTSVSDDVSLEFIPAGKKEKGGGDDAVIRLVSQMRKADVRTVFGIVDRDNRADAPPGIVFSRERRTLENFAFDPLIVGYMMLRARWVDPPTIALDSAVRYSDVDHTMAQQVVDGVLARLKAPAGDDSPVECHYIGGFSVEIPNWYLNMPKAELESTLRTGFPELNRSKDLRTDIVRLGYYDHPEFVPAELRTLFVRIAHLGAIGRDS